MRVRAQGSEYTVLFSTTAAAAHLTIGSQGRVLLDQDRFISAVLARPEFAANFATWRDQRLELYRAELNELKNDQTKSRAYVRHLEAAYQRERQRVTDLEAELAKEKAYSAKLEQPQSKLNLNLQRQKIGQRLKRLYRKGQRGLKKFRSTNK